MILDFEIDLKTGLEEFLVVFVLYQWAEIAVKLVL